MKYTPTAIWRDDEKPSSFGLSFSQQVRGIGSVPDGVISQESLVIVVETKLGSTFDEAQIEAHFRFFKGERYRFALLLGAADNLANMPEIGRLRERAKEQGIGLRAISFESLIGLVRDLYPESNEDMLEVIHDYTAFCDGMDLLPSGNRTIFVPPCGQSSEENIEFCLYYCPAERTIRRTKYLGIYSEKTIQAIGEISKVVVSPTINLENATVTTIDNQQLTTDEQLRIARACEAAQKRGWRVDSGHSFFLCEKMAPTEFTKKSRGGIQNRRYIDLADVFPPDSIPSDLSTLADGLRSKEWK